MSIPHGFRYLKNMALYQDDLKKLYIKYYGKDLENHFDLINGRQYEDRVFCLDCKDWKTCRGKLWEGCQERVKALKIIKGES